MNTQTLMKNLLELPALVIFEILNAECIKQDPNQQIFIMNIPIFTLINELVGIYGRRTFDFMSTHMWLRTIATMNIFGHMDKHIWPAWDKKIIRYQRNYISSGIYTSRVHDLLDFARKDRMDIFKSISICLISKLKNHS